MAFYYTQNLVEGAGGSTLMGALKLKDRIKGKKVVLQMSGGNASTEEVEKAITYSVFRNGIIL
jgi:threonine dehydratase